MLGGLGEKLGGMFTSCRSWRLTKVLLTKAVM